MEGITINSAESHVYGSAFACQISVLNCGRIELGKG